jgi:hypothetical protein
MTEEEVKKNSSTLVMRLSTDRKVDLVSRKPSCHLQSHTGSRWALPIMCSFCVSGAFPHARNTMPSARPLLIKK